MNAKKISNGANDRPRDSTIAQTGEGLPDDSGKIIDVSDEEVERVRLKLTGKGSVNAQPKKADDTE